MTDLIHLICDYGPGDMAWSEVVSAFYKYIPATTRMHRTSVPSFDTVATGFILAQLSLQSAEKRPENTLVFANTAPRKDNLKARKNNEGEGLLYVTLKNGVNIIAVNSGYSLSFVKDEIQELWSTHCEDKGSQFRSRDFFPAIVGQYQNEDYSFLNHKLSKEETVPDMPQSVTGYVDSFGNIKTTIRDGASLVSNLNPGDRLKISIGTRTRTATVATGSFNIMEGDLAFAPGSSGHDLRYWELFKRGGSAWLDFGMPPNGVVVNLESI